MHSDQINDQLDSSVDPDSCRYCKFWASNEPDRRPDLGWQGRCRRYAKDEFPRRYSHEWCGEFESSNLRARIERKETRERNNENYRTWRTATDRAIKAEKALKAMRAELRALKAAK